MSRLRRILLAVSALLLVSRASASEPDLRACVSAYEQGQQLPRRGELLRAREELLVCARAPCPEPMWADCLRWLDQVERNTPSVVFAARDGEGRDVADVRVALDGRPLVDQLDARAIPIDPGEHTFRFQRGDNPAREERVLVREGEKARLVTVQFGRADGAPGTPAERPAAGPAHVDSQGPPVAAYVVGGIGVAALGAFTYFALAGRADYFDAKGSCAPGCSSSDVEPARVKLIAADLLLGVSVVSLGVATYLFLTRHADSRPPPGQAAAFRIDVRAGGGSGAAYLGGTF